MSDAVRTVCKDDGRVRNSDERGQREHPGADQPNGVFGRDEVQQRGRNRADVDSKVEPFLERGTKTNENV